MSLEPGESFDRRSCLRVCATLFERDVTNDVVEHHHGLLEDAKKLCYRLRTEHDSRADPIHVTVRSVPVPVYANLLRHYYVRVEGVLDVHPGTSQRLSLAWWHNTTVLETDRQERELRLCGTCCDEFLDSVWRGSERFHIVWNNCDQMLNRCEQSFALGVLAVQLLWYPLFGDFVGLLVSLLAVLLFAVLRIHANTQRLHELRCDRNYCCPHVIVSHDR